MDFASLELTLYIFVLLLNGYQDLHLGVFVPTFLRIFVLGHDIPYFLSGLRFMYNAVYYEDTQERSR